MSWLIGYFVGPWAPITAALLGATASLLLALGSIISFRTTVAALQFAQWGNYIGGQARSNTEISLIEDQINLAKFSNKINIAGLGVLFLCFALSAATPIVIASVGRPV